MSGLIQKLSEAKKQASGFDKDGRNTDQKYSYISADQVLSRIGNALADVGVVVLPTITAEAVETVNYESYGKQKSRIDATVEFTMVITDGETNLEAAWIGRGTDYSTPDKALYKAITSGHKYFLMKLFNVGVGNEDSEHDTADDSEVAQAKPRPQSRTVAQLMTPRVQELYDAPQHVLNALKQHPRVANSDKELTLSTPLKDDTFAAWEQWLVDRKQDAEPQPLFDTEQPKAVVYG